MIQNTRFAVAVHILTLLAACPDEALTSEQIACSVNTHPVAIRRALAELRRAGLVASRPGTSGGWRLLRPAEAINLQEVFCLVGEPPVLALHPHPNPDCPVGGPIQASLSGVFSQAEQALERSLAGATIAGLLHDLNAHKDPEQP